MVLRIFLRSSYFSNICFLFERLFAQKNSNVVVEWFFGCFWRFYFLIQSGHFSKAMALAYDFAGWPILKIVSFFEYLVFFRGFFCTEEL